MRKFTPKSKLRLIMAVLFLGTALFFTFSAKKFFSSPDAQSFLGALFGAKRGAAWLWCPINPVVVEINSNINSLSDDDIQFVCSVVVEQVSTQDLQKLEMAQVVLAVSGDNQKKSVLRADPNYEVFDIDGLPFKNRDWTRFFQAKAMVPSP